MTMNSQRCEFEFYKDFCSNMVLPRIHNTQTQPNHQPRPPPVSHAPKSSSRVLMPPAMESPPVSSSIPAVVMVGPRPPKEGGGLGASKTRKNQYKKQQTFLPMLVDALPSFAGLEVAQYLQDHSFSQCDMGIRITRRMEKRIVVERQVQGLADRGRALISIEAATRHELVAKEEVHRVQMKHRVEQYKLRLIKRDMKQVEILAEQTHAAEWRNWWHQGFYALEFQHIEINSRVLIMRQWVAHLASIHRRHEERLKGLFAMIIQCCFRVFRARRRTLLRRIARTANGDDLKGLKLLKYAALPARFANIDYLARHCYSGLLLLCESVTRAQLEKCPFDGLLRLVGLTRGAVEQNGHFQIDAIARHEVYIHEQMSLHDRCVFEILEQTKRETLGSTEKVDCDTIIKIMHAEQAAMFKVMEEMQRYVVVYWEDMGRISLRIQLSEHTKRDESVSCENMERVTLIKTKQVDQRVIFNIREEKEREVWEDCEDLERTILSTEFTERTKRDDLTSCENVQLVALIKETGMWGTFTNALLMSEEVRRQTLLEDEEEAWYNVYVDIHAELEISLYKLRMKVMDVEAPRHYESDSEGMENTMEGGTPADPTTLQYECAECGRIFESQAAWEKHVTLTKHFRTRRASLVSKVVVLRRPFEWGQYSTRQISSDQQQHTESFLATRYLPPSIGSIVSLEGLEAAECNVQTDEQASAMRLLRAEILLRQRSDAAECERLLAEEEANRAQGCFFPEALWLLGLAQFVQSKHGIERYLASDQQEQPYSTTAALMAIHIARFDSNNTGNPHFFLCAARLYTQHVVTEYLNEEGLRVWRNIWNEVCQLRIQRAYRHWLRTRHIRQLAQQLRENEARVQATSWAATCIQAVWKGHMVRTVRDEHSMTKQLWLCVDDIRGKGSICRWMSEGNNGSSYSGVGQRQECFHLPTDCSRLCITILDGDCEVGSVKFDVVRATKVTILPVGNTTSLRIGIFLGPKPPEGYSENSVVTLHKETVEDEDLLPMEKEETDEIHTAVVTDTHDLTSTKLAVDSETSEVKFAETHGVLDQEQSDLTDFASTRVDAHPTTEPPEQRSALDSNRNGIALLSHYCNLAQLLRLQSFGRAYLDRLKCRAAFMIHRWRQIAEGTYSAQRLGRGHMDRLECRAGYVVHQWCQRKESPSTIPRGGHASCTAATEVQRMWRGFLGRRKAFERKKDERAKIFKADDDHAARIIQNAVVEWNVRKKNKKKST